MSDPYKVLGVDKSADKATIKRAYRRKAKDAHPDRGGDKEQFQAIQRAWDVLGDGPRKDRYDRTGDAESQFGGLPGVAAVLEGVFQSIFSALSASNATFDQHDVVKMMRENLASSLQIGKQEIVKGRKVERQIENVLKRFKKKKDDGLMATILAGKLESCRGMIAGVEEQMSAVEGALKWLCDCSYDVEKAANKMPMGLVTGQSPLQWRVG